MGYREQVQALESLLYKRNTRSNYRVINEAIQAADDPKDLPNWVRDELLICSRIVQNKDDQPRKAFDLIKWKRL